MDESYEREERYKLRNRSISGTKGPKEPKSRGSDDSQLDPLNPAPVVNTPRRSARRAASEKKASIPHVTTEVPTRGLSPDPSLRAESPALDSPTRSTEKRVLRSSARRTTGMKGEGGRSTLEDTGQSQKLERETTGTSSQSPVTGLFDSPRRSNRRRAPSTLEKELDGVMERLNNPQELLRSSSSRLATEEPLQGKVPVVARHTRGSSRAMARAEGKVSGRKSHQPAQKGLQRREGLPATPNRLSQKAGRRLPNQHNSPRISRRVLRKPTVSHMDRVAQAVPFTERESSVPLTPRRMGLRSASNRTPEIAKRVPSLSLLKGRVEGDVRIPTSKGPTSTINVHDKGGGGAGSRESENSQTNSYSRTTENEKMLENISRWKKADLVEECERRGLQSVGTKEELRTRIVEGSTLHQSPSRERQRSRATEDNDVSSPSEDGRQVTAMMPLRSSAQEGVGKGSTCNKLSNKTHGKLERSLIPNHAKSKDNPATTARSFPIPGESTLLASEVSPKIASTASDDQGHSKSVGVPEDEFHRLKHEIEAERMPVERDLSNKELEMGSKTRRRDESALSPKSNSHIVHEIAHEETLRGSHGKISPRAEEKSASTGIGLVASSRIANGSGMQGQLQELEGNQWASDFQGDRQAAGKDQILETEIVDTGNRNRKQDAFCGTQEVAEVLRISEDAEEFGSAVREAEKEAGTTDLPGHNSVAFNVKKSKARSEPFKSEKSATEQTESAEANEVLADGGMNTDARGELHGTGGLHLVVTEKAESLRGMDGESQQLLPSTNGAELMREGWKVGRAVELTKVIQTVENAENGQDMAPPKAQNILCHNDVEQPRSEDGQGSTNGTETTPQLATRQKEGESKTIDSNCNNPGEAHPTHDKPSNSSKMAGKTLTVRENENAGVCQGLPGAVAGNKNMANVDVSRIALQAVASPAFDSLSFSESPLPSPRPYFGIPVLTESPESRELPSSGGDARSVRRASSNLVAQDCASLAERDVNEDEDNDKVLKAGSVDHRSRSGSDDMKGSEQDDPLPQSPQPGPAFEEKSIGKGEGKKIAEMRTWPVLPRSTYVKNDLKEPSPQMQAEPRHVLPGASTCDEQSREAARSQQGRSHLGSKAPLHREAGMSRRSDDRDCLEDVHCRVGKGNIALPSPPVATENNPRDIQANEHFERDLFQSLGKEPLPPGTRSGIGPGRKSPLFFEEPKNSGNSRIHNENTTAEVAIDSDIMSISSDESNQESVEHGKEGQACSDREVTSNGSALKEPAFAEGEVTADREHLTLWTPDEIERSRQDTRNGVIHSGQETKPNDMQGPDSQASRSTAEAAVQGAQDLPPPFGKASVQPDGSGSQGFEHDRNHVRIPGAVVREQQQVAAAGIPNTSAEVPSIETQTSPTSHPLDSIPQLRPGVPRHEASRPRLPCREIQESVRNSGDTSAAVFSSKPLLSGPRIEAFESPSRNNAALAQPEGIRNPATGQREPPSSKRKRTDEEPLPQSRVEGRAEPLPGKSFGGPAKKRKMMPPLLPVARMPTPDSTLKGLQPTLSFPQSLPGGPANVDGARQSATLSILDRLSRIESQRYWAASSATGELNGRSSGGNPRYAPRHSAEARSSFSATHQNEKRVSAGSRRIVSRPLERRKVIARQVQSRRIWNASKLAAQSRERTQKIVEMAGSLQSLRSPFAQFSLNQETVTPLEKTARELG